MPEGKIYQAIPAIMHDLSAIKKEKKAGDGKFGYMFRGIDDVMNALHPLLSAHGVFVTPEVLEQERTERVVEGYNGQKKTTLWSVLKIRFTFHADDGSSVSCTTIGEGMDNGDKASNKAMSIAMKYAMFQVFCIPTEEMEDPDATLPVAKNETLAPAKLSVMQHDPTICSECKKPITDAPGKSGKMITAYEIAQSTLKIFGKPLCAECGKKNR